MQFSCAVEVCVILPFWPWEMSLWQPSFLVLWLDLIVVHGFLTTFYCKQTGVLEFAVTFPLQFETGKNDCVVKWNLVDTTAWEIPYWFEIHGRFPGHQYQGRIHRFLGGNGHRNWEVSVWPLNITTQGHSSLLEQSPRMSCEAIIILWRNLRTSLIVGHCPLHCGIIC